MSYEEIYKTGIFSDEIEAFNFIKKKHLIDPFCPYCQSHMVIRNDYTYKYGCYFYCSICNIKKALLHNTVFFHSNLKLYEILKVIYYWAKGCRETETQHETHNSHPAISAIFIKMRRKREKWRTNLPLIGGIGTEVQIDETAMTKQKNHVGRYTPTVWVAGGKCKQTKQAFQFEVPVVGSQNIEKLNKRISFQKKKG